MHATVFFVLQERREAHIQEFLWLLGLRPRYQNDVDAMDLFEGSYPEEPSNSSSNRRIQRLDEVEETREFNPEWFEALRKVWFHAFPRDDVSIWRKGGFHDFGKGTVWTVIWLQGCRLSSRGRQGVSSRVRDRWPWHFLCCGENCQVVLSIQGPKEHTEIHLSHTPLMLS